MNQNRNRRAWPPSPTVHVLDISDGCFMCGGSPVLYLEVVFVTGLKTTILDMRHAPVCSDACATKQYLVLANQGFYATADSTFKRVVPCEKMEDSPPV